MSKELNTKNVELDEIYALKREGKRVIIGDKVRAIRVNTPNGVDYFYRKDGEYLMEHAGEANVGEYKTVKIGFEEYTAEKKQEHEELVEMIAESVDAEIAALEEEWNV